MTALDDTYDLMLVRQSNVVAAFDLEKQPAVLVELSREALGLLGVDATAASLPDESVPSMRLVLDVVAWRWVEQRAALGFDFSADGGSYQRSQLAGQATDTRRTAEARASAAGLAAFAYPAVEVDRLVNAPLADQWRVGVGDEWGY